MYRYMVSFIAALAFSASFFFVLVDVIDVHQTKITSDDDLRLVEFIRLKKEDPLQKKVRVKPKKTKPKKKPLRPKISTPKPEQPKVSHTKLNLNKHLNLDLTATSALGDAYVMGFGESAIYASVLPLVRVDPINPKRAKMMKKEGYVKLEFTITQFGNVKDIVVAESKRDNLFDYSAIRALTKWKFKPKLENNIAIEQRAMVQLNFERK
ncbi:MAG: energy transducer TonB [Paraglaciecola sp.]|nr:energy transducer TonB [Paraglaciecola sp.]